MIVVVDERDSVAEAYRQSISREGYAVVTFRAEEFNLWVSTMIESDIAAIDALILGECVDRVQIAKAMKRRSGVLIIAINDIPALDLTLQLFEAGIDDVVRKPVHAREIIARIAAIKRRNRTMNNALWDLDGLVIYGGGRFPVINGRDFQIPRRELRILEHLAANHGRRMTRAQIFAAVYGIFDERVEECVVESHISKLRKKLRGELGYDPIDMQRFLGYQLTSRAAIAA